MHEPTHRALFSPKSWGKHEPRPADNFINYTEPEASCLALLTATSGRFEHEAGETPDSTKPDQNPRSRLRAKPHFGDGETFCLSNGAVSGIPDIIVAHACSQRHVGLLPHRDRTSLGQGYKISARLSSPCRVRGRCTPRPGQPLGTP